MPLILGALALLGVGGLVYKSVATDTQNTVASVTPNITTIGVLALAGFIIYENFAKR